MWVQLLGGQWVDNMIFFRGSCSLYAQVGRSFLACNVFPYSCIACLYSSPYLYFGALICSWASAEFRLRFAACGFCLVFMAGFEKRWRDLGDYQRAQRQIRGSKASLDFLLDLPSFAWLVLVFSRVACVMAKSVLLFSQSITHAAILRVPEYRRLRPGFDFPYWRSSSTSCYPL